MSLFANVAGWAGTIMVLLAYFLVSTKRLTAQSISFQVLNALGAAGLMCNTLYFHAYPGCALNLAWFGIAVYGMTRARTAA